MFTFDVCWGNLGNSIFGNSSSAGSNTTSKLPSRLPFRLLWLFLKLLLMFNMCQYLFINSFMFGRTGLYVTENGIESLGSGLQCLKSNDLSRWSTLSICFLTIDSLQPFSKSSFQQALYSISSWECFLYFSKVEHMRLILSAWLYGILFLNRTGWFFVEGSLEPVFAVDVHYCVQKFYTFFWEFKIKFVWLLFLIYFVHKVS